MNQAGVTLERAEVGQKRGIVAGCPQRKAAQRRQPARTRASVILWQSLKRPTTSTQLSGAAAPHKISPAAGYMLQTTPDMTQLHTCQAC